MTREEEHVYSYLSSLEIECKELRIENESLREKIQRLEAGIEREVERRLKQRLENHLK